jgi:hypothetical protein
VTVGNLWAARIELLKVPTNRDHRKAVVDVRLKLHRVRDGDSMVGRSCDCPRMQLTLE